ncbi:hypothetical protein HYPSUDRAFT_208276, partial [Hypholoma sublateritium FD-334 SS-4]
MLDGLLRRKRKANTKEENKDAALAMYPVSCAPNAPPALAGLASTSTKAGPSQSALPPFRLLAPCNHALAHPPPEYNSSSRLSFAHSTQNTSLAQLTRKTSSWIARRWACAPGSRGARSDGALLLAWAAPASGGGRGVAALDVRSCAGVVVLPPGAEDDVAVTAGGEDDDAPNRIAADSPAAAARWAARIRAAVAAVDTPAPFAPSMESAPMSDFTQYTSDFTTRSRTPTLSASASTHTPSASISTRTRPTSVTASSHTLRDAFQHSTVSASFPSSTFTQHSSDFTRDASDRSPYTSTSPPAVIPTTATRSTTRTLSASASTSTPSFVSTHTHSLPPSTFASETPHSSVLTSTSTFRTPPSASFLTSPTSPSSPPSSLTDRGRPAPGVFSPREAGSSIGRFSDARAKSPVRRAEEALRFRLGGSFTASESYTLSGSDARSASYTPSGSDARSASQTSGSFSASQTMSDDRTRSGGYTPSASATPSGSYTASGSYTLTPGASDTLSVSRSPIASPSRSPSVSYTPSASYTISGSYTPSASYTLTPGASDTLSVSRSPDA